MSKMNSSTPSYSFHGSNSSHSKDSGQGGRTYHVPNYATSYANEKSHLISVTFDEDKGAKKTIISIVFMFLLLLGSSAYVAVRGLEKSFLVFGTPGAVERSEPVEPTIQLEDDLHSSTTASMENVGDKWVDRVNDELAVGDEIGFSGGTASDSVLYWDKLRAGSHCLAYGTRKYTARLRNVSFWENRTRACMETPVQINGLIIPSPDECDIHWPFGGVRGYWNVSFRETDCSPVWGKFVNKGCIKGPHRRLFRSRLWNIKKGEDRMLLCETAPAQLLGNRRLKPDFCKDQGVWGTYGFWTVEDTRC